MRSAKNKQNKQKQPRNIFKLLLVILAGMILFIIVLFFAASSTFRPRQSRSKELAT